MKSYIAHLDYSVPKTRITLSHILSDGGLSERDLAQISQRLLGKVVPRQKLIDCWESMSNMSRGERRREANVFMDMLAKMFASRIAQPSEISYIIYAHGNSVAVGDPWLYNEYVDGRKLPADFQNYQAAEDLVKWLLKQ